MGILNVIGFTVLSATLLLGEISTGTLNNAGALKNDLSYDNGVLMQRASWANRGNFGCSWDKNNISFTNGEMSLTLKEAAENSKYEYEYSGAEYRTRDYYGYGLYLVKMKPAKNDGIVSSFFTYTGPSDNTRWDEIDIEFLGKDTTSVQFNFFSDGKGKHEYIYNLGYDASKEYHEYGFLWTDKEITWYVDGRAVHTVTADQCALPITPGKIMMNIWNGVDNESMNAWLNRYDGKTNLTAYYDYFEYIPYEEIDEEVIEEPIQDISVSTSETLDLSTGWENDNGQYRISPKKQGINITRGTDCCEPEVYIYKDIDMPMSNPRKLSIALDYTNGYKFSITPALVDSNGKVYKLENKTYINQKQQMTLEYDINYDIGKLDQVRLYINSESKYIDINKHSYVRILLENVEISK